MEKRVLSGSAKRKRKKEKETKDTALVQQIPSISTFFNKKREQGEAAELISLDNVHPAPADVTALDATHASAKSYPSPSAELPSETSGGAAAQPPLAFATANDVTRDFLTSPVKQTEEMGVENEIGDADLWCETVTDPALWENYASDKAKTILIERGASTFQNRRAKYLQVTKTST